MIDILQQIYTSDNVAYWIVPLAMTLIDLQGHLGFFGLKINVAHFSRSLTESWGDLTKDDIADDIQWAWKVISSIINGFKNATYIIYKVDSNNCWTSCVNIYFYTVEFDWKNCCVMLSTTC